MISQIIESFQTLVDAAAATKDKGWQFKIKNYQKAIKLLTSYLQTNPKATITTIDQAYELFRDNGWKLKGEPYQDGLGYQDRKPKSAILTKIHELLTHGQIKMVESAKLDPRIFSIKDLCRIPGVGPSKASLLYEQGFTSISDIRDNLSSAIPSIDLTHAQTIGLRHLEDLEKRIPRAEPKPEGGKLWWVFKFGWGAKGSVSSVSDLSLQVPRASCWLAGGPCQPESQV